MAVVFVHAVAQPFVGHCTQGLLGTGDEAQVVGVVFETHRIERGKPPYCAAEVCLVDDLFAAVPFQVDENIGGTKAFADGSHEPGKENVVDLGPVGCRYFSQDLSAQGFVEREAHLVIVANFL